MRILFYFHKKDLESRVNYITGYRFSADLYHKIHLSQPHLTFPQIDQLLKGLKTYFLLNLIPHERALGMPSKMIDVAWHEFILFTREYREFCDMAFDRFFDHTPNSRFSKNQNTDLDLLMTRSVFDRLVGIIEGKNASARYRDVDIQRFIDRLGNDGQLVDLFQMDCFFKIEEN